MAEPESHTLRLLLESRQEFKEFRENTNENFSELARSLRRESVLGRYAAAAVEQRLMAIEKRLSALERSR